MTLTPQENVSDYELGFDDGVSEGKRSIPVGALQAQAIETYAAGLRKKIREVFRATEKREDRVEVSDILALLSEPNKE